MATITTLSYDIEDIAGKGCNLPVLHRELEDASLNPAGVRRDGNTIYVDFQDLVTLDQKATCDTVVLAHQALNFSPTVNAYNDPEEHSIQLGDWVTVGTFNSGPLPEGVYILTWSAEAKIDTEGLGNRIGLEVSMNGYECSRDTLAVPDWAKYQDGEWVPIKAGQSFILEMKAKTIGCAGSVRRIRAGLLKAM
jgi:hypothetical protein